VQITADTHAVKVIAENWESIIDRLESAMKMSDKNGLTMTMRLPSSNATIECGLVRQAITLHMKGERQQTKIVLS
jgi:hypothetical protein